MRISLLPRLLCLTVAAASCNGGLNLVHAASCPRITIKINEVSFAPPAGQRQWVELRNTGSESVDVSGMELVMGTTAFTLPIIAQEMPTNGLVLVYFDAEAAAHDLSFTDDNKVVLHAPGTNVLGNPAGFCSLYQVSGIRTRDTLVDFVAWGAEPGESAALAVAKNLWPAPNVFLGTDPSSPLDGPSFKPVMPGGSIGRLGEQWTVFSPGDASPGAANGAALVAPELEFPNDGLVTVDAPSKYWWTKVNGATAYEIQIATDAGFGAIVLSGTNTDHLYVPTASLPVNAKYWWRVRTWSGTSVSGWSGAWSFTLSLAEPPVLRSRDASPTSNSVPIVPLGARKDTTMLATSHSTANFMCEKNNANNQAWDAAHAQATIGNNDLESWWCWGIGITMVNRYYGGTLRRDEAVYQVKSNLLHDADAGSTWNQYIPGLYWALNQTNGASFTIVGPGSARPADTNVIAWIDAGRPIYYRRPGHIMVVRAYRYMGTNANLFAEFVNIDNDGGTAWWQWNTVNFGGCAVPNAGLAGRAMDPKVTADADGDAVVDFDEEKRFASDKTKADSDTDKIPDKIEIFSWAFPTNGVGGNVAGKTFHIPDVDGDGLAPQVDSDTDNGGVLDGDEDKNADGLLSANETDVYDKRDDLKLDLVFCIDLTGSMGSYINAVKANATAIINSISTNFFDYRIAVVGYKDFPPPGPGSSGDFPFRDFVAFSTNASAVIGAINALSVSGGGDTPESVYSGLIHSINGASLGGWRPDPVKRGIIVMGDAPAHDPEPVTGYTLGSLIAAALAGGVTVAPGGITAGEPAGPEDAEDETLSGPIPVFPVRVGSDSSARASFLNIATNTGGTLVDAPTAAEVPAQILAVLQSIKASAAAVLVVTGPAGETALRGLTNIVADASRSVDPEGCGIRQYDWDWNGDGTYDETTLVPITTHDYPAGFTGPLTLRVTTIGGSNATATLTLAGLSGGSLEIQSSTTLTAANLNHQTGLYEQSVTITNTGAVAADAVRINIAGLPAGSCGIYVYNATGTNGGVPYVQHNLSLPAGSNVVLRIEYYSLCRTNVPEPTLTVEAVPATVPPVGTGGVSVLNRYWTNGTFVVEFETTVGSVYVIEYSSDMANWKQAQPPVTAYGSRLLWIDSGPPKTESPPPSPGSRFYRVRQLP